MSVSADAIVIGAGVNGLVAASYLARAGKRVIVLEASQRTGGLCDTTPLGEGFAASLAIHSLYALDPRIVNDLRLARHGLEFAERDLPLVGLRSDGKHVVIMRDTRTTMQSIALQSRQDLETWPRYWQKITALARAMRAHWWEASPPGRPMPAEIGRIARQGAGAFLDGWFDSESIRTTLAFDAAVASPLASGSALLLLWRAAQEMCGLQGAVAVVRGGAGRLAMALRLAAESAGAQIRTGERATEVLVERGRIRGVRVASGDVFETPLVLSSLPRRVTLLELAHGECVGLAEWAALARAKPVTAAATFVFTLSARPMFGGVAVPENGRFTLVDRTETYTAAHAACRAGRLPDELALEFMYSNAADSSLAPMGRYLMSVVARPLPASPLLGWKEAGPKLTSQVIETLDRFASGFSRQVIAAEVLTPDMLVARFGAEDESGGAFSAERLLSDWRTRIATPVDGLFLCGASAEPLGAVSGRAGRIAAGLALRSIR